MQKEVRSVYGLCNETNLRKSLTSSNFVFLSQQYPVRPAQNANGANQEYSAKVGHSLILITPAWHKTSRTNPQTLQ